MYIKQIYILTRKDFFFETLQKTLHHKLIHIKTINECKIKIDILILDSIDLESLVLLSPISSFIAKKKHYIKYLIYIGEKYENKNLYKNLYIQKEIFITRPFSLIKLKNRINAILYDYLPFLLIDNHYLFDYQNSYIMEIKSPYTKTKLTEKEMQILQHMLFAEQHVNCKQNISKLIWNFEDSVQSHTIQMHITKLKQKVKDLITINNNEYYLNVKEIY